MRSVVTAAIRSCGGRSVSSGRAPISTSSWCWRCSAPRNCTKSSSAFRRARPIGCCIRTSKAIGSSSAGSTSAKAGSFTRRCRRARRATITTSTACCGGVAGFDFACEFDYVGFWDLRIEVAENYQVGRVFIAGDAAHSHPPYGGYGLNNGLDDVANLGWKLAAMLQGWGSDALLKSYSEERQPIFLETGRDFIEAGHPRRTQRFSPATARTRTAPNSSTPGRIIKAPPPRAYSPTSRTMKVRRSCSARRTADRAPAARTRLQARTGHHLPPQLLSSGRNVFEELGPYFTLLAFDADDSTVAAFARGRQGARRAAKDRARHLSGTAAKPMRRSLFWCGRIGMSAWASDSAPSDAKGIMGKAVGRV